MTITGGTGAYLAIRGQAEFMDPPPQPRLASDKEDPASRRAQAGGGGKILLHLIPLQRPQVIVDPIPWVYHTDWSDVTAAKPAKPGELLHAIGFGLGPVRTQMDPGDLFPAQPEVQVNSPVEVTLNGKRCEVLKTIGNPEMNNVYILNFSVPYDLLPGTANLRLAVAWLRGPDYKVYIGRP